METETITIPVQEYLDLQAQWKPEHTIALVAVIICAIAITMLIITFFKYHTED